MCGAVRYEATGEPIAAGYCHCESCRSHSGGPVVVLVSFLAEQVAWSAGTRAHYRSSPEVRRAFCRDCGTPLTWEGHFAGRDLVQFHVGTLDRPDAVVPGEHTHCAEKLSWFEVADRLPRYQHDFPAADMFAD